jgi:uncharacterized protein
MQFYEYLKRGDIIKIGVIADTHIPRAAKRIPDKVFEIFEGVELILHAGDAVEEIALEQLESIAPVLAVHGNRDSDEFKQKHPETRIITLEGFRIGLIHGHGEKGTTRDRMPSFFQGCDLSCIIFGHSHIPFMEEIDNILYFNPGSPTMKKRQAKASVGILILMEEIRGEICFF